MNLPADDPRALLRASLSAAERRWRGEWLAKAAATLGLGLAIGFAGWALLSLRKPEVASYWIEGTLVAMGLLGVIIAESQLRETEPARIQQRMDQSLGLSDAVVTAAELQCQGASGEWATRQLAQTADALHNVDWRKAWPIKRRRGLVSSYLVVALAAGFLGWRANAWQVQGLPPPATARERADAAAMRALFDDWEKSGQEQGDPELKSLLEELRPERERLARQDAALDEREAFTLLSRVEEKLAARQAKLEAQSLRPMAADLATALDGINGLAGLAAAVRRGDFQNAERQASDATRRMQAEAAPQSQSVNHAETEQRLDKLVQQFAQKHDDNGQRGMEDMKEGLQRGQSLQVGKGLDQLKRSLAGQNARDAQKRDLASQQRQVSAGKHGLGDRKGVAGGLSLLPRLTTTRPQQSGKGADRSTNPERSGAATVFASGRTQADLSGTTSAEGESDKENIATADMIPEKAGTASTTNFRLYEALSKQAVADENLPLAHRQTIRRYFESIRPPEQK